VNIKRALLAISQLPLAIGLIQAPDLLLAQSKDAKAGQSAAETLDTSKLKMISPKVTIGSMYDGKTPVLIVGETHTSKTAVRELTASLSKLKKKGITHLALEIPEDFQTAEGIADLGRKMQAKYGATVPVDNFVAMDDYLAGKVPREKMLAFMISFAPEREEKNPGLAEENLKLIDRAHKLGIKVRCVDIDAMSMAEQEIREQAALHKGGDPIQGVKANLREKERSLQARNGRIAKNVNDIVVNGGRVAMLAGEDHTGAESNNGTGTIDTELSEYNIATVDIDVHGGDVPKDLDSSDRLLTFKEEAMARDSGLAGKRFIQLGLKTADIDLHVAEDSSQKKKRQRAK